MFYEGVQNNSLLLIPLNHPHTHQTTTFKLISNHISELAIKYNNHIHPPSQSATHILNINQTTNQTTSQTTHKNATHYQ